jgi:hypothetical protein
VGCGRVIEKRGAGRTAPQYVRSILARQKEGRGAAIGLGNDPEIAFVRIGRIDRIGREKARALPEGEVVFCGVIGRNNAPVALNVAKKTFPQILGCASIESAGSADDTPKRKLGSVLNRGGIFHDKRSFEGKRLPREASMRSGDAPPG